MKEAKKDPLLRRGSKKQYLLNAPYAGITRIRLKGSAFAVSAAYAAPLY